MIDFVLKGDPKALKRHRSTRTGRMYDPSAKDKKEMWLQIAKFKPKRPFSGNIYIRLVFVMPRPKNHYRTGKFKHLLKDQIPEHHSFKPDLDNLIKMMLDCISGTERMIIDDSQVCRLQAEKIYGKNSRTEVYIEEIY